MCTDWQFADPPNAATLTTEFVLAGSPILRVYHDYDGGWQFHGATDQPSTSDVGRVVSLQSMVARDPSVVQLHDLLWGWRATRDSVEAPWVREKNHPFPTFEEDGYYLEDAVWMSQYRDDVNPPAEEIRNSLTVGTYAKLIFRFAAEDADRQDGEVERMWVRVVALDDDGNYVGELANDPAHDAELSSGDTIHFHPLHVMEVVTDNRD